MEKNMNENLNPENFENMTPEDLENFQDSYLIFTSNFIEYVREIYPDVFNRAADYATTINR